MAKKITPPFKPSVVRVMLYAILPQWLIHQCRSPFWIQLTLTLNSRASKRKTRMSTPRRYQRPCKTSSVGLLTTPETTISARASATRALSAELLRLVYAVRTTSSLGDRIISVCECLLSPFMWLLHRPDSRTGRVLRRYSFVRHCVFLLTWLDRSPVYRILVVCMD